MKKCICSADFYLILVADPKLQLSESKVVVVGWIHGAKSGRGCVLHIASLLIHVLLSHWTEETLFPTMVIVTMEVGPSGPCGCCILEEIIQGWVHA